MDRELANYLKTQTKISYILAAGVQLGRCFLLRTIAGNRVLARRPPYLSDPLRRGAESGPVTPYVRGIDGGGVGRPSVGALKWAAAYEIRFAAFLSGDEEEPSDREEYWTLHQFNWALQLAMASRNAATKERLESYLEGWIGRLGNREEDPAWRSFSICERVSNWVHLCRHFGVGADNPKIWANAVRQLESLAERLEYFPSGNTDNRARVNNNNHLINNGRALYLGGTYLHRTDLAITGAEILRRETARLFTSDGMIDEGTSHYQFIMVRDYLEVLEAAIWSKDSTLFDELWPKVEGMLEAASLFVSNGNANSFPFFGDISPDPPPYFMPQDTEFWNWISMPAVAKDSLASGKPWFARRLPRKRNHSQKGGWTSVKEAGFYRWDSPVYTFWTHARPEGRPRQHAHNDWGGFQLHVDGKPALIDGGRDRYVLSADRYDMRNTLAHNTMMIDQMEQSVIRRRDIYATTYLNDSSSVTIAENNGVGDMEMEFHGYERLSRPAIWRRSFVFRDREIEICDRIEGEGTRDITIAFHMHPELDELTANASGIDFAIKGWGKLRLSPNGGGKLRRKKGGDRGSAGGLYSSEYGKLIENVSIFVDYRLPLPCELRHQIKISRDTEPTVDVAQV